MGIIRFIGAVPFRMLWNNTISQGGEQLNFPAISSSHITTTFAGVAHPQFSPFSMVKKQYATKEQVQAKTELPRSSFQTQVCSLCLPFHNKQHNRLPLICQKAISVYKSKIVEEK